MDEYKKRLLLDHEDIVPGMHDCNLVRILYLFAASPWPGKAQLTSKP